MSFKSFLQENIDNDSWNKDKYMLLYRIDKSLHINPHDTKYYSRKNNPDDKSKGVFLSRFPDEVATHHGISSSKKMTYSHGNLYAYWIPIDLKRHPRVSCGYLDGAWEMFIPKDVWEEHEERIIPIGAGEKTARIRRKLICNRSDRANRIYNSVEKRHKRINNEFKKEIKKDIKDISKFCRKQRKYFSKLTVFEIIEKYEERSGKKYEFVKTKIFEFLKDIFHKNDILFHHSMIPKEKDE